MYELLATSEYPPTLDSPRLARRLVTAALVGFPPEIVEAAALVTSELVTNAVAHADAEFTIRILRGPDVVRIEVSDPVDRAPIIQAMSLSRGGGRGLAIVDRISASWGIDARPGGGKTVWSVLAITA